jgi:dephospho-CoA kinase
MKKGLSIGLTGGIACGKSEVGRILEREEAQVRDADELAHELIRYGGPLFDKVVERFGAGILGRDGEIDRRILGRRVFAGAADRKALEALIHPEVIRVLREWIAGETRCGKNAVAIVPLLFEVGWTDLWDAVVCVASSEEVVIERLKQRGLSEREALARMSAQMPLEVKIRQANHVIRNDGTFDSLEKRTREVWRNIVREERPSW